MNLKSTVSLGVLSAVCTFGAVTQAEARPHHRHHHRGARVAHVVGAVAGSLIGRAIAGQPTVVAQPAPVMVQSNVGIAPSVAGGGLMTDGVIEGPGQVSYTALTGPFAGKRVRITRNDAPTTIHAGIPNYVPPPTTTIHAGIPNYVPPPTTTIHTGIPNPVRPASTTIHTGVPNPVGPASTTIHTGIPNPTGPSTTTIHTGYPNPTGPASTTIHTGLPNPAIGDGYTTIIKGRGGR